MQVSPETPAPKRSRAKAKSKPKPKESVAAAPKAAARKPGKSKAEAVAAVQPVMTDITSMIATAAYYLAAERNFAPGHELDDWLEAERRMRSKML